MAIWSSEIKELEKLHESFKGQLADLEKELEQLTRTEDANVIMLYSRRCIEVILTDLCECELKRPRGTEPLKGIIDRLHKERKVPDHITTSMHGLNDLSTYGTHPKDFDPEQIKPVLVNLDIIIKWYLKYKESHTIGKMVAEEEKRQHVEPSEEAKVRVSIEEREKPTKSPKQKLLSGVLITAILLIAAILAYPKIFKRNTLEKLRSSGERISVVVMPFQNMTNDTIWNVWQDGIQNELITSLTNSQELKVRQTESINNLIQSKGLTNYASITPSVASNISQKLDANVFIYGSIKEVGNTIRINAQLIDSKTQDAFKSFQINGIAENILHMIDSLSVQVNNFLIISKLEKELPVGYKYTSTTNSPEAFRYFIYGEKAFYKKDFQSASKLFSQALDIDSNFISATISLSFAYTNQHLYEEAKKWCIRLYKKRDQMPMELKIRTNRLHADLFETPNEDIEYIKQLQELDNKVPNNYFSLGIAYSALYQFDKAIPQFEKALEIYDKWGTKPIWIYDYLALGYAYYKTGQYKKAKNLFKKAEQDFPDDLELLSSQSSLSLAEGDTISANKYIEKCISALKDNSVPEVLIQGTLANIYEEAGIFDVAEKYYREALSLEPEDPSRMNNFAYFLIDKDRNLIEGLELIDKALELSPNVWYMIDTKGWGLYKHGNYTEALKFIQRANSLKPIYDHEIYLHLEAAKKAVANQKNN